MDRRAEHWVIVPWFSSHQPAVPGALISSADCRRAEGLDLMVPLASFQATRPPASLLVALLRTEPVLEDWKIAPRLYATRPPASASSALTVTACCWWIG